MECSIVSVRSPSRHQTGQKTGLKEPDFALPSSVCPKLPAGRSGAHGVRKPLDVHQDPIHPYLSRWVAVFKGPAEPLGALLQGAAEPLDAILWGLAEPIEAVLGGIG